MLFEPKFTLLKKEGKCELRQYEAYNIILAPDSNLNSFQGFRLVFDYIQGENQNRQKISMTTPVINELVETDVRTTAFVMPDEFDFDTLPNPTDNKLQKIHVPAQKMATIRFTMTVSESKIKAYEDELKAWISQENLEIIGSTRLARYNPPFIPGFLKRNELWIEVKG